MGAQSQEHYTETSNKEDALKSIKQRIRTDLSEHGCMYSGAFGEKDGEQIIFQSTSTIYSSWDEAWNDANPEKWGAVKVVKWFKPSPKQEKQIKILSDAHSVQHKKLYNELIENENKQKEQKLSFISDMKNSKSSTKKCLNCASSIDLSYIDSINCPVCKASESMLSKTNSAKIAALVKKNVKIRDKMTDLSDAQDQKLKAITEQTTDYTWLALALCSC